MNPLYLSRGVLASYDGDGAEPPSGAAPAAGPNNPDFQGFTEAQQAKVNALLAADRRKHQSKLETTIEEMQSRANLTLQERESLAQQLEELRRETRTEKEQREHEKKKLEEQSNRKVADAEKTAKAWEDRYKVKTLEQALDNAVSGDAFNPDIVKSVVRQWTRLVEKKDEKGKGVGDYEAVVDFPDADPNTGEAVVTQHTPKSAVKRMKELPNLYGRLFKSGVVSGIGGSGSAALTNGGKVDYKNMTQAQYMELRSKNPAALGLRPQKRR